VGQFSGRALSQLGTIRQSNDDDTASHSIDVPKVKRAAKKWTQANVAKCLEVARETVRDWLSTNGESANTSKPDARVAKSLLG
jgi:hypothetical protein